MCALSHAPVHSMDHIDYYSDLSRAEEDCEVDQIISSIERSKGGTQIQLPQHQVHLIQTQVEVEEEQEEEYEEEEGGESGGAARPPGKVMEQEKRIRREIANSNERRRMQSINAGFSSLRSLLPHHEGEGEKLSKAAILQQTAEYIYSLEQEKTRLLSQNCQLKRLLGQTQHMVEADETDSGPAPKRRLIDTGQKLLLEDEMEELVEVQNKYERERRTRMLLEEKVRTLEAQMFPSGRRVVHRFQSGEEEYIETTGHTTTTVLTPAAKKQGANTQLDTILLQADRLPSILQCAMKGEGNRVEVERLPHLSELAHEGQAVEIASVQDPETGATRQYIVTQMCDSTSKQNLETIVEAIRHLEGDHLFSEESGPHQVVKEEVVESCILDEETMVEMTLSSSLPSISTIQQVPMSSLAGITLPNVPVSLTLPVSSFQPIGGLSHQVPVSVNSLAASLVSSLQQPVSLSQLPPVVSLQQQQLPTVPPLPTVPLELPNIGPPQTSPVNLELQSGGNVTPTSELSNSPPQSSPVNLAQTQSQDQ